MDDGGRTDRPVSDTRKGPHPITSIADALKQYLSRAGLKRRLDQASVLEEWGELVGETIASVTKPESVTREGILFVRVKSSAWMQELQLMSPTILSLLGKRGKKIKRILWRLG